METMQVIAETVTSNIAKENDIFINTDGISSRSAIHGKACGCISFNKSQANIY